jgi:5-methylcytosine-specific restriction endonuclease McrA
MRRSYIPAARRQKVMQEARHRCGYCSAPQDLSHIVLEIEHIIPPGAGGTDAEENLWAACSACNAYKGDRTHARDPIVSGTILARKLLTVSGRNSQAF